MIIAYGSVGRMEVNMSRRVLLLCVGAMVICIGTLSSIEIYNKHQEVACLTVLCSSVITYFLAKLSSAGDKREE